MVADAKDSNLSKLELLNIPGGPQAFELAMKFCYGMNFEITTSNVAQLRCAAEYLEMTEDYRAENLIKRAETYLNEVVIQSLEKSIEVLAACEMLPPTVEEIGIVSRCVEAIAMNACKEQLVSGLSRLDCDNESTELKSGCLEWWVEDLSVLRIDFYQRVICAMGRTGVRQDSIIASLMHYAQASLKGINGKCQVWNAKLKPNPILAEHEQRTIMEALVSLMPPEKNVSIPLSFLFGMLKMGTMLEATIACRLELERRIAFRLEMVSLDDLLIPSMKSGDSLFDVDTVQRILINFLQRIEEEENEDCGYESEVIASPSHGSLLKVGRLMDEYLAEIAPDPYLSLQKFIAVIEILPDYARVIDDGLYRAVDIYLKVNCSTFGSKLSNILHCDQLCLDV